VNAEGLITLGGNVTGTPEGDLDNGSGDGADVDLESDTGNILVTALVDVSGVAPDGDGGSFTAATDGDVIITGKIALPTPGAAGGGDAEFDGNNVTVSSVVDASSALFGGTVDVSANGLAKLTAGGVFRVDSDNVPGGIGGEITIQGCSVEFDAGTTVSALGPSIPAPAAITIVQASSSLIVGGTIVSGAWNEFDYPDSPAIIHILPGASVTPQAKQVAQPNLPCCDAVCATTTTTTVPATSTTTSTAPVTTTTTPRATSTTIASITTTVTSPVSTTTTQPPPCSGEPSSLDGASCLVGMLSSTLETSTSAELPGARTKRRLTTLLKSANRSLEAARSGKRVTAKLRTAHRKLDSFQQVVQQALQRKRGALDPHIGQLILDVVSGAASEIDVAAATQ